MSEKAPTDGEGSPAEKMTLIERLRALAGGIEEGAKRSVAVMPAQELTSTVKTAQDLNRAADQLEAFEELLGNCIGAEPVREEAEGLLESFRATDAMPPGPSLEWVRAAADSVGA